MSTLRDPFEGPLPVREPAAQELAGLFDGPFEVPFEVPLEVPLELPLGGPSAGAVEGDDRGWGEPDRPRERGPVARGSNGRTTPPASARVPRRVEDGWLLADDAPVGPAPTPTRRTDPPRRPEPVGDLDDFPRAGFQIKQEQA